MANKTLYLSVLIGICLISCGSAFSFTNKAKLAKQSFAPISEITKSTTNPRVGTIASSIATLPLIIPNIVSAADDYEVAELPPVYVPILFAIGILGGVGVLTASLGDVMDEGM